MNERQKVKQEGIRPVVVTTDKDRRGVFAGLLQDDDGAGRVVLTNAQMCVYWSEGTHGVLGLAAHGPADGSRVGPVVPRIELDGVTCIIDMTPEAVEKWRAQPWG